VSHMKYMCSNNSHLLLTVIPTYIKYAVGAEIKKILVFKGNILSRAGVHNIETEF
jgi:hypothetical protein